MNTRNEYLTFEELWTFCAQEELRISTKEKSQKKYDDQAFTTKFNNFRNKRNFGLRKETDETSVAEEREPSKKAKQDKNRLLRSQGNNILQSSCTYHVYIVSVHILHIYFLEDKMFK
jgi:hypothetical protein